MPHLADVLWIISGPGRAEAALVCVDPAGLRGRGHRRPSPSSVTHPVRDILGINWSFMRVTYIIRGTCV